VQTIQDAFDKIIGKQLSSVEFVRDYLQLRFDGPVLTIITDPTLEIGTNVYQWTDFGFKDRLCQQIGRSVTDMRVDTEKLLIVFSNGSCVKVSLLDTDYIGPEAVMLRIGNDWLTL
jgi:hypothetical protein